MRKCVSVVAVASATLGAAACSASDQPGEPAGAARPLVAQAATSAGPGPERAVPVHGLRTPTPVNTRHDAPSTVGAPVLIPSGTTDGLPQPATARAGAAGRAATVRAAAAAAAAAATAPALPQPAPPPPPAQERHSPVSDPGYDPNAAASAQIVAAVAAAQQDGKAVLLDFGANWCAACKALSQAMHTPRVAAILAQSYHVVQIDLGNADPQHLSLATQYAAYGTFGMPLLVVLNPDGTVRTNSAITGEPKFTEAGLAAWLTQYGPR